LLSRSGVSSSFWGRRSLVELAQEMLEKVRQAALLVPVHEVRSFVSVGTWLNELMSDTTAHGEDRLFVGEVLSESHLDIKWCLRDI